MYVVQIASELTPVAKVGGLADVVHGLSKELSRRGAKVEIILPKYDCLRLEHLNNLKIEQNDLWSFDGPYQVNNTIWSAEVDGLKLLLIEPHHSQQLFQRGMIYGCNDDIDRFNYFARAAMEFLFKSGRSPDVLHVHDWPTALIPVLYKNMYKQLGFHIGGTLLTIHNMQHQGRCRAENINRTGLSGDHFLSPDKMQDPLTPHDFNLLKGGIVYADKITTVSPTYEKEIQTEEGAFGLHDILKKHRKKLSGILNGIDEEFWNPEKDPYLAKTFPAHKINPQTLDSVLTGKKENKRNLQKQLGLKQTDAPMIVAITRLVPQKSPELLKYALFRTLELGGQFILLGSTPIPSIHREFDALQLQLQGNENAVVLMDKNEGLAHKIYASSDMFIIPSQFEPCGLTQMIALRYGTIPIARRTGGLCDTVFDTDSGAVPSDMRNGFTFEKLDAQALDEALLRAMACYEKESEKWKSLIVHGMSQDFSWKNPVQEYMAVYKDIASERGSIQQSA